MNGSLSRRRLFRLGGGLLGSSVLAALSSCAAPAPPTPPLTPPKPTPAPAPTRAAAPTVAPASPPTALPAKPTVPAAAPTVVPLKAPGKQRTFKGTAGLTLPFSKDPVKVRGYSQPFFSTAPGIKTLSDQVFFKELAKRSNLSFEWEMAAKDAKNPVDLIMASGNLPDWFLSIGVTQAVDYGQQGALAPLNDLIDKHCPNFKKLLEDNPELRGQLIAPDGKIYFFPRAATDVEPRSFSGVVMRQDWLDEVGLKVPTTTDELYQVLKAFKQKDRNRFPLTQDPRPFIWSFGVGGRGSAEAIDFYRDGEQVKFAPMEEGYREGLAYLNKLYSEGLLDPEYATAQKNPDFMRERWLKGISGVMFAYASFGISSLSVALKGVQPNARLIGVLVPAGPRGDRDNLSVHNIVTGNPAGAIAASSKYKEIIAQYADYCYSPEGSLLFYWGLEGDTFTYDASGMPQYTDKVVNNPYKFAITEYVWTIISPQWYGPCDFIREHYLPALIPEARAAIMKWAELPTKRKLPVVHFTKDENATLRKLMTDVSTLLDEKVAKFINGAEKLDGHAALRKQLEGMDVQKAVGIYQAAYTRFLRAKP